MSVFDDFKRTAEFDSETKTKISKVLPAELSEILCRYGCRNFLQGYLRSIHPFEYQKHDSAIIGKKTSLFLRLLEDASFRKKYFDIHSYIKKQFRNLEN